MKKLLTISVFTLFLLTVGCQSSKTTADNSLLLEQNYDVSQVFVGATEKKTSTTEKIASIGAEFTIDVTALEKDSLNSALKNIKITLDKGVKNYEFQASTSSAQSERSSDGGTKTSAIVSVSYYTSNIKGKSAEWKHFLVNSGGEVKSF